jgi:hypothetical protein
MISTVSGMAESSESQGWEMLPHTLGRNKKVKVVRAQAAISSSLCFSLLSLCSQMNFPANLGGRKMVLLPAIKFLCDIWQHATTNSNSGQPIPESREVTAWTSVPSAIPELASLRVFNPVNTPRGTPPLGDC